MVFAKVAKNILAGFKVDIFLKYDLIQNTYLSVTSVQYKGTYESNASPYPKTI
jgi:hypothetical protein